MFRSYSCEHDRASVRQRAAGGALAIFVSNGMHDLAALVFYTHGGSSRWSRPDVGRGSIRRGLLGTRSLGCTGPTMFTAASMWCDAPKGLGRFASRTEKTLTRWTLLAVEGEGTESGHCRRTRPFAVIDIPLGGRRWVRLSHIPRLLIDGIRIRPLMIL